MNNQENLKKYAGAIIKGGIASIPVVGSLVVELLNVTIPNQRQDRVEKLLNLVASKVFDLDREKLKKKFNSYDFIDIFEEILRQSVKATSNERLEYLASVIDYGLRQEEIEHLQLKRLLEILEELNDVEVIILQFYQEKSNHQDFMKKLSSVFDLSELSPDRLAEHQTMLENYKSHLINLGLIGKSKMFDSTSNLVGVESNLWITKLGMMLLEKIGRKADKQTWTGEPINPLDALHSAYKKLEQKEKEIKKELELEAQKAKKVIESEIRKFESEIRRRNGRLF